MIIRAPFPRKLPRSQGAPHAGAIVVTMHHASTPNFWHERWTSGQIGFHEARPNAHLVRWWPTLALAPGARVLVPLCGKSKDLAWLLSQGHNVVGVELSPIACAAFFAEQGLEPTRTEGTDFVTWSCGPITLLQGDIFALELPGTFDAVWDRAATIALPPDVRARYAPHVRAQLKPGADLLIVSLVYDATRRDGPPFSVPDAEIQALHPGALMLDRAHDDTDVRYKDAGGVTEVVWRATQP